MNQQPIKKKQMLPAVSLPDALNQEKPLQMVGVINAYSALLAERVGYKSLYLSGAGVANASYGLPDLGITTLDDVLEDIRRITSATQLPLLVDVDTGFGGAFNIARTVKEVSKAGAAGIHLEDQIFSKRCGHRPNKAVVSQSEMVDRIKAAVDARSDHKFTVMARTDALAQFGLDVAIERCLAYIDAGADMIFPEAVVDLNQYGQFVTQLGVPILANVTEFGVTPLFTIEQLTKAGVSIALYPLSAFRAMSLAALKVYQAIRANGSQNQVIDLMQTREELYDYLDYYKYEKKLDELFKCGSEENINDY